MPSLSIIIPTYSNRYWIARCLNSLVAAKMPEIDAVHIVDNHGDFKFLDCWSSLPIKVTRPGKNTGWTGALALVWPKIKTEFVMFLNDDTEFEILPDRLSILLSHFSDPSVGMVGPATGIAMGVQALDGPAIEDVKLLIGFCQIVRRSALEKAGGIDSQFLNGGDDLDISIRLRDAGYRLVLDRRVFVYHHAFKTGNRLFGNSRIPGGWNSQEMATRVYDQVTAKHGRERLMELIAAPDYKPEEFKV